MIISTKFGEPRKDGRSQFYARLIATENGKRLERNIKVPGVVIKKSDLNRNLWKVKNSHPMADELNQVLDRFRDKLNYVSVKYAHGSIDFGMAVQLVTSGHAINSVLDYIDTIFGADKGSVHLKNVKNSVITITNKLELDSLMFSQINENNLLKVKRMLFQDQKSPHTFNKYMRDIRTVWNHAKERNYIIGDSPFRKTLMAKTPPIPEVEIAAYEDLLRVIERIDLSKTDRKSHKSAVKKFEAVALWLLMFSMRGFYQEDIHALSAKNLDFDFYAQVDNLKKGYHERVRGNMLLLKHKRHKTKYPMNIFIGIPPILPLIRFLRISMAYTNPLECFNNASELGQVRIDRNNFIRSTSAIRIDPLRIFSFTHETDPLRYNNYWRAMRKCAKKINLPPFKVARKTFMTISETLGISISDSKLLIGHADISASKHYRNIYQDKIINRLANSHLEILQEFKTAELYEALLERAREVLGDFGEYLYASCQIGAYTPYFNADLKSFLAESNAIPDEKMLAEIKAATFKLDTKGEEFLRSEYEDESYQGNTHMSDADASKLLHEEGE